MNILLNIYPCFSIRGILGVFLVLTCNFGIVLAFVLGYYFNYAQVSWIVSSLSFVFVGCFWFMPETPQHLARVNKIDEAEHSLRYYRNIKANPAKELSEELQLELQKLKTTEKPGGDADDEDNDASGVTWADFGKMFKQEVGVGGVLNAVLSIT